MTMCVKEIDNENTTKANTTSGNMYTIYTIQIHPTRKPTKTIMRKKYANVIRTIQTT